jgi:hypothetical protein
MSRFVYQGVLQDGNGKRLADGNIAVLLAGTSTPANVYQAASGGVAVASVTTASDGSWSFYVDESDYAGTQRFDITLSKSGYLSDTISNIEVLPASSHVGLTVKDATTNSKQLTVDISGATAAKTVTLASSHTDNRTHTFPDQTDTLVGAVHGGVVSKIVRFLTSGATTLKTMTIASSHTDDRTQTLQDRDGIIANTVNETFTTPSLGSDAAGDLAYHNGTGYVRLPKGSAGQILTQNDGATAPEWQSYIAHDAVVKVSDIKATTVDGGTFTSGAWQVRDINTEDEDTSNIATISANQITLAAGTYDFCAAAPAVATDSTQMRLYDTTGTAVLLEGQNTDIDSATTQGGRSEIRGTFTLGVQSVLEIQHRAATTKAATGFGAANSFGGSEIYTTAEFRRRA